MGTALRSKWKLIKTRRVEMSIRVTEVPIYIKASREGRTEHPIDHITTICNMLYPGFKSSKKVNFINDNCDYNENVT